MTTGHKTKDSGSSSSCCRDKEVRGKQHTRAPTPHLCHQELLNSWVQRAFSHSTATRPNSSAICPLPLTKTHLCFSKAHSSPVRAGWVPVSRHKGSGPILCQALRTDRASEIFLGSLLLPFLHWGRLLSSLLLSQTMSNTLVKESIT